MILVFSADWLAGSRSSAEDDILIAFVSQSEVREPKT